jgi:2,3-diketo-5-methylthio-1-phosphopentane phosphatase
MTSFTGISHLLLDIEGTTCPVSFVAEVLFPYAARQLPHFLQSRATEPTVQALLADVQRAWSQDTDPDAMALLRQSQQEQQTGGLGPCAAYLQLLIRQDRKLTPLKELQGLIWREGYAAGQLVAPLYADVPAALERWQQSGVVLGVYSSGSVQAQKLLYCHSNAGDLTGLFSHWFDTRIGQKQDPESYHKIAAAMETGPQSVLFVSDAVAECEAAETAGMKVLFSHRTGNPQQDPGVFSSVSNYNELMLESASPQR